MKKFIIKAGKTALTAAVWIALWYALAAVADKSYVLPYPHEVAARFVSMCREKSFILSALNSLLHIFSGLVLGVLTGLICGTVSAVSDTAGSFLAPLSAVIKAAPVASFILLFYMFAPRDVIPTVISALIVIPLVWKNVSAGLQSADWQLLETAKVFRMKNSVRIRYIYLPAVKPHFVSSVLTGSGLAWKAGIAAEVICSPDGTIGYYLCKSRTNFDTAGLFAQTAAVIIISFALEKIIGKALKKWNSGT